jgi:hypothetical protein
MLLKFTIRKEIQISFHCMVGKAGKEDEMQKKR